MKILRIIAFVLLPLVCCGQEWFGESDEWVSHSYVGIVVENFENDTIITGKSFRKYKREHSVQLGGDTIVTERFPLLVREKNDSVYYWDGSAEHLIYDFTMEVGDSMQIYVGEISGCHVLHFRLDSFFVTEYQGTEIRVQEGVFHHERATYRRVRIYEGIGVAETGWWDNDQWFLGGFLIPDLGITCYADASENYLCEFSNDQIVYKKEGSDCNNIKPYRLPWFLQSDVWINSLSEESSLEQSYNIIAYKKDTLLGEDVYKVFSKTNVSLIGDKDTTYTSMEPLILRENESEVFFWDKDSSYLIYDFNMKVGDTLFWRPTGFDEPGTDSECNTYFILEEVYIRPVVFFGLHQLVQEGKLIQEFGNSESRIQITDGVGWTATFDEFSNSWERAGNLIPGSKLKCVIENSSEIGSFCTFFSNSYHNLDIGNCFNLVSSSERPKIDLEIKIAPNPVNENFQLIGDLSSFESYTIYDINGRKILRSSSVAEVINAADLPSGLYFLRLQSRQSPSKTIKFSKIN